jgi:hypothetical protein
MENSCIKKGLGVIVLILFLLTTCLPIVNASEGKPDLIVLRIGFAPVGDSGRDMAAYATIKNIGDVDIQGEFTLKYTFKRLVFGTIAYIDTSRMFGSVAIGEEVFWGLIYEDELPKFGFFEFKCTVNPGGTIEESNYNNNFLSQKYVAFLGHWKVID